MIRIDDKYVVEQDYYSYRLAKEYDYIHKKTGKKDQKTIGYYSDLDGALKAYCDEKAKEATMDIDCDIVEAIRLVRESREESRLMVEKALAPSDNKEIATVTPL